MFIFDRGTTRINDEKSVCWLRGISKQAPSRLQEGSSRLQRASSRLQIGSKQVPVGSKSETSSRVQTRDVNFRFANRIWNLIWFDLVSQITNLDLVKLFKSVSWFGVDLKTSFKPTLWFVAWFVFFSWFVFDLFRTSKQCFGFGADLLFFSLILLLIWVVSLWSLLDLTTTWYHFFRLFYFVQLKSNKKERRVTFISQFASVFFLRIQCRCSAKKKSCTLRKVGAQKEVAQASKTKVTS